MGVETDEESRALFLTGPQPQVTELEHCPPPFPEPYMEAKPMANGGGDGVFVS